MRFLRKVSAKARGVQGQYYKLCQIINDANQHFWGPLVDKKISFLPNHYKPGSAEEIHLAVHQCRAAWDESEGAIARVDSDTARPTPVYGGRLQGIGTGDPHWKGHEALKKAFDLPKSRGTGAAFPLQFQPPLPTLHPANLFPPTPTGRNQTLRFVNRDDQKTALVYADGACANNGRANPRGGWAVVFGPADGGKGPCIVSGRLEDTCPFGEQHCVATNNRAELRAAIAALRLWDWEKEGLYSIVVATDSSYVVDGATDWAMRWVHNGWSAWDGGRVKNRDLWELLLGEVERWEARGGYVEFWKIPRSRNGAADKAAKAAANKPAVMDFTDVVISDRQPAILMLLLEPLFDTVHGRLATRIASKAKMERATTVEAALAILGRQTAPQIILVGDGGITRHRKVCTAIIGCLRNGATVVLAGCFSSMVNKGQLNRLFARLGLPWEQGSCERTMVNLARDTVHGRLETRLPSTYNQKALFVKNVTPSAAWYISSGSSGQAAMTFAKVGKGRLGYVGDLNGEEATDTVVLAMCGLLD